MTLQPGLGREVFTYQVGPDADTQQFVSTVGPDVVFEHGLCTEAIMGKVQVGPTGQTKLAPELFHENPAFVKFLRELIASRIFDVEGLQRAGQQQGEGYVYLIDARTPDPQEEVPPVDIIGGVKVQGGALQPGSYQHNPCHRLLTNNGFFMLPAELETTLTNELRARCAQPR